MPKALNLCDIGQTYLQSINYINIFRSVCEDKAWHRNVCSHPLSDIRNKITNHAPSKNNGETIQSGSRNTESFEVLVTCLPAESSKSPEIAHKLLEQKEECKGNGKIKELLKTLIN